MYALRQIVFYLGPMTANEAAVHHGRVIKSSFASRQIARLLGARPDVRVWMERPEPQMSEVQVYDIREPASNIHTVSMRRKVDRYIRDELGLTEFECRSMRVNK